MAGKKDLEKRIAELEARVTKLEGSASSKVASSSSKSKKMKKEKSTKKTKRKVNEYFKKMLEAKRKELPSFEYNGQTYKGTKHATLGMVYKKA